jgi:competence protein ComEC
MVLTHPDNDHLGGLLNVLSNFEVGRVLESGQKHNSPGYEKFLAIIERRGIPYHLVGDGSCIRVGPDIKIEVLHPKELLFYATQGETSNNNSTVMRLSYGEVSFLFTGDIEQPAEEELCNYGIQLHSTIIKVPHHGGPTSSSTKFLELVKPECAVISVGARNPFGHPSPETLKRYEILNTKIYRTDRDGAVIITADEKGFRVRTMSERWKPLAILD